MIKAQQEIKRLPMVLTNSVKTSYQKRRRQIYRPDYIPGTDGRARRQQKLSDMQIAKSGDFTHSHSTTATAYTDTSTWQK